MPIEAVIHIDDSRELRDLVRRAIGRIDPQIQYRGTANAEEGIGWIAAEDHRRVVVLLDVDMPENDGFEVLRQLGSKNLLPTYRVIMFSSSTAPADRERSLALGAAHYCVKPVAWEGMVEAVRSVVKPPF